MGAIFWFNDGSHSGLDEIRIAFEEIHATQRETVNSHADFSQCLDR